LYLNTSDRTYLAHNGATFQKKNRNDEAQEGNVYVFDQGTLTIEHSNGGLEELNDYTCNYPESQNTRTRLDGCVGAIDEYVDEADEITPDFLPQ
jgi:hypothetical protein